jgi:hypothetical protein
MGHASSTYLLQVSEFGGTYKNPFKSGGRGIKYTKWQTIDGRPSGATMDSVKQMWKAYHDGRDPAKITRYRVRYKGQTVISHQGRVYQAEMALGGRQIHMRYVETIKGCEELI